MNLVDLLLALLITAWIFCAALGLGTLLLRLLRLAEGGLMQLWLAAAGGLGALSVLTLLLGMVGLLYPLVLALLMAPLAVVGAMALLRTTPGLTRGWLSGAGAWPPFRVAAAVLLLLAAATAVWIGLTHALMPPHEWDEIAYHLTLAKLYVAAHRVVYVPFIVHSNWPMNSEMLFSLGLLFGSDIAPHLTMLGLTLLIGVGLLATARRFFDDRVGVIALALFITVPVVKRLAGTGLIDVALGLYVLGALVALERWREVRSWQWLALCGLFAGFAAGSKIMGGAFPLLFGLLVLFELLRRNPRDILGAAKAGALFGLAGLLVAGPWYLRSFLFTGNPIWPFAFHILGGRDWDNLGDEYHMHSLLDIWTQAVPRTPLGLLQAFGLMITRPEALGDYRGGIGFVGPLGALGAALVCWRAPRILRAALLVSLGFFLLWFAFVSHQLRFLLPIVPLLVLAAAYFAVWLYDRARLPVVQVALLLGVIVLVARETPWLYAGERELFVQRAPYLSGQVSREAWLDTQIDSMPLFRYANTQLPTDAKVLLLPYENRTYYLDRSYIWGHPISQRIIPFEQFSSVEQLETTLRELGITHVIDNPKWIYEGLRYWQHDRALMLALRDQCGEPLAENGEAVLYALKNCAVAHKP